MSPLPEHPKIPERFTLIPVTTEEYRLHSLTFSLSINDTEKGILLRIMPLLDGEHSLQDICNELRPFSEESVLAILDQLMEHGVLEGKDHPDKGLLSPEEYKRYQEQLTFFSYFVPPKTNEKLPLWPEIPTVASGYQEALKKARVAIYGLGRIGSQLVRTLALSGVGQITGIDPGMVTAVEAHNGALYSENHIGLSRSEALQDLVAITNPWVQFAQIPLPSSSVDELAKILRQCSFAVLCADSYNPEQYLAFNQACLKTSTVWTSCRLFGFEFEIGPTIIPYKTPCYMCFDLRRKSNLTDYEEYSILEAYLKTGELNSGSLPIVFGAEITALEVIKAITHFMEPVTYAHILTVNLLNMQFKRHPILKIPRCAHCGCSVQDHPSIHLWDQPENNP